MSNLKNKKMLVISFILMIIGLIGILLSNNINFDNRSIKNKTFSVTFISDDNKKEVIINEGKILEEITPEEKDGYIFVGWYLGEELYNFNSPVKDNITLKAVWKKKENKKYTITFDSNGGSLIDSQIVEEGEKGNIPPHPSRPDYAFIEWQLDGEKYNFSVPITSNIVLKAKWEKVSKDKYIVYFNSNGGSPISTQILEKDDLIQSPTDPQKIGYSFIEWQLDGKKYNFSTKITSDITLDAVWEKKKYTISFNANGGTGGQKSNVIAYYDTAMPSISKSIPTRKGYKFAGWYDKKTGGTQYYTENGTSAKNWNKNSNATLYARWIEEKNYPDQIHFMNHNDATIITSNGKCGLIDMMYASTAKYKKSINDTKWVKLNNAEISNAANNPEKDTKYAIKVNNQFIEIPQRPTSDGTAQNSKIMNGSRVANYIKNLGCDKLDFIIMTHNHSDHIGGAKEIAAYDLVDNNTIVFYKEDVIAMDNGVIVDTGELQLHYNNAYFHDAYDAFSKEGAKMCDVSKGCSSLFGNYNFIKGFTQEKNPFTLYATNVDWTYYFNFGNFKINLYNLYRLANHAENLNSIVTLITHKVSGKKTVVMGDQLSRTSELIPNPNLKASIINPVGTCSECIYKGVENQIADVIGKVDILRLGHHGHSGSNSYYMLNKFNPDFAIASTIYPLTSAKRKEMAAMIKLVFEQRNPITNLYITGESTGAIVSEFNNGGIKIIDYDLNGAATKTNLTNVSKYEIPDGWYQMDNVNTTEIIYVYVSNNKLLTGWNKVSNRWYYFDTKGIMQTGLQKINNQWYYLGENGSMKTGLQTINGKYYYFRKSKNEYGTGSNGSMVLNQTIIIDGVTYYFDSTGIGVIKE